VSAKLTPEICINNAASNSRLTTAGRWDTVAETILRTVSRLFFFSLPTSDEKTIKLHLHAEKLTETVLHLNLGHLVGFFFVWVCVVLFYFMCPLWWDNYTTTSEAPSPGLDTEMDTKIIKTETSLHLNLEVFFFYFSFCFILFIIYIDFFHILIFYFYSYLYSFYFLFSILCLSNACSAFCRLVH
jgi:hypothetical protein